MNAVDVMTQNPRTLPPSASLSEAIALMRHERVRHLPLTVEGRVVGMLSDRDLRELSLGALLAGDVEEGRDRMAQAIGDVAARDVVTVQPQTELRVIVDLLVERRIGAVPVVDADGGRIVGLVSVVDVLRAVRDLV